MIDENIVEGTAEVDKATFDDYEGDDILHGDGHEMLVVCKSLLTNDWLKTTIFQTTCTISDRVCRLIIVRDSDENVMS